MKIDPYSSICDTKFILHHRSRISSDLSKFALTSTNLSIPLSLSEMMMMMMMMICYKPICLKINQFPPTYAGQDPGYSCGNIRGSETAISATHAFNFNESSSLDSSFCFWCCFHSCCCNVWHSPRGAPGRYYLYHSSPSLPIPPSKQAVHLSCVSRDFFLPVVVLSPLNFGEKLLWESLKQALNSLLLLLFSPCHDVVLGANGQETFSTLEQFGELMGYKLKPVGKQLVRVVQVSLSHNHYRVRVAALKAIHRLPHPPNFLLLTSLNLLFFKHFFQRRKKHGKK